MIWHNKIEGVKRNEKNNTISFRVRNYIWLNFPKNNTDDIKEDNNNVNLNTEINVYTVIASTKFGEEKDWVYFDKEDNLYDYVGFEIPPKNYDKFYHLKYTFIKNDNSNYYISDIKKI